MLNSLNLYQTGRYGVVDLYYRHIWINISDEHMAHEIRNTFWPKAATVVFDLTCFTNYADQTVDSDVSLNWKIPATNLLSPITSISLSNPELNKTQTSYTSNMLVNENNSTLLTLSRQKELQQQMLLYRFILSNLNYKNELYKEFVNGVQTIFQTELDTKVIIPKIIKLAGASINGPVCPSVHILRLFNSLYE